VISLLQIPQTSETYVHRSGRTARASKEGLSLSLVSPREVNQFNLIKKTLGIDSKISTFPVDTAYMPLTKDRVLVASQLQQVMHRVNSKKADKNWLAENAEKAEIEVDFLSNREQETYISDKLQKEINRLSKRLKLLLSKRLVPVGASRKFVTVNLDLLPNADKVVTARDFFTNSRNAHDDLKKGKKKSRKRQRR